MSPRSSNRHTTAPQGNRTNAKHSRAPLAIIIQRVNQSCGKSVSSPRRQNYFLKFPPLLKFFKTATTPPPHTAKTHADSGVTMTEDRRPTGNMRLASCGVKCLNSSAVFQINFSAGLTNWCSEISHKRQVQNRWQQPY